MLIPGISPGYFFLSNEYSLPRGGDMVKATTPKHTKKNGFATSTLCGVLASSTTSIILTTIISVLILNSFIGQEFISIGAIVINFISAIIGTILIGYMKEGSFISNPSKNAKLSLHPEMQLVVLAEELAVSE
jgi:hypothetical protein